MLEFDLVRSNKKYIIRNCYSDESTVIIPEKIDGHKIESIDLYAFNECENLECVKFSKFIDEITYNAFVGCKKLKNIIVDDNDNYIFEDGVLRDENKLKYNYDDGPDLLCHDCSWDTLKFADKENYGVEIIGEKSYFYTRSAETAIDLIEKFLEPASEEEQNKINELIEKAFKDRTVRSKTFESATDDYWDWDEYGFGKATKVIAERVHRTKND